MRLGRTATGRAMITIGVVGVVVALVGVIVGQQLAAEVEESVDDSLALTSEALTAVSDSIVVTTAIVETVRTGITTVGDTLSTVQRSVDETGTVLGDVAVFTGGSLPDALEAVDAVLPTIESIAGSIDTALEVLEDVPFGPTYDPVVPFDDAVGQLRTAIGPLPEELRGLSGGLGQLATASTDISTQLRVLDEQVDALDVQVDEVEALLARYQQTASEARALAEASRVELGTSASSTRWMIVVLGLTFAAGQLVPIWLGWTLLGRGPGHVVVRRHEDDHDGDPRTDRVTFARTRDGADEPAASSDAGAAER